MRRVVVSSFATLDHVMTTITPGVTRGTSAARVITGAWPRPGGAAYYAARPLTAQGYSVHPLTQIGDDANGDAYRAACRSAGIAIEGLAIRRGGRSATCVLVYHADGGYSCLLDSGSPLATDLSRDQASLVDRADLVILAAAPAETTSAIVERLTAAQTVAWILKDDPACFPVALREVLAARADFIFCNAAERHLVPQARAPHQRSPWIIETRGADSILVENSTARAEVPVHRVETIDATGAGDTLCGAMLAHWLAGNIDIATAVKRATIDVGKRLMERVPRRFSTA